MKRNVNGIIKLTSPNSTKKCVRERKTERKREEAGGKMAKNNHKKNIFMEQIKASFKNLINYICKTGTQSKDPRIQVIQFLSKSQ